MVRTTDKEAKRKQILEAALKVFSRKGLSNFKMSEIAEEAQVGKGTLYEYFRTKDELVIGSVDQFMADFEDYVIQKVMRSEGPMEKIRTIISASIEYSLENEKSMDALLDFYAIGIPRSGSGPSLVDLQPRYREVIQMVGKVIQEGIDEGMFRQVDTEFAATMLTALLDGLFFHSAIGVLEFNKEHLGDRICDIYLNGLMLEGKRQGE